MRNQGEDVLTENVLELIAVFLIVVLLYNISKPKQYFATCSPVFIDSQSQFLPIS